MCGIIGSLLFNNSNSEITDSYITAMRDTLIHRGPDGAGTWISPDGRVGLGHRRLAIIDLSNKASQPMGNSDGSVQISFNGEIYNHAEIRQELELTDKYTWKTDHSDTEVILHAYEEWGIDCIHRFRGMFAIAIWDARTEELWLLRDRMGIKPLYYSMLEDRIIFASEIKAILEDPKQKRSIDEEAFFHYFTYLFVPAPLTLFEGIKKLPNASKLCIKKDGSVIEDRYWDALDNPQDMSGSSEIEISKMLLSKLRASVKDRSMSDVPVGVFLSGGIDSSTNAALFAKNSSEINTFSIAYDEEYKSSKSELDYAKMVAGNVGANYHEKTLCEDDLINFLPEMAYLQDEPIADPVCVPVYYVSKLARKNGVIVCQVGEGADELFCGYESWLTRFYAQKLINRFPVPRFIRKIVVKILDFLGLDKNWRVEYLRRDASGIPIFWGGSSCFTDQGKQVIFSKRIQKKFKGRSSWDAIAPIRDRFEQKCNDKDPLKWMTYLDLNSRLPDLLLMRIDKMSMGVSLEGRVPFLDHQFVEFAMDIPTKMKIKGGDTKHILKESIRGVIPDEIIDRKKQGFSAPIQEWLSGEFGEVVEREVRYFCEKTDLMDWERVKVVINKRNQLYSWQLLNLALWWRTYIEKGYTQKDMKLLTAI